MRQVANSADSLVLLGEMVEMASGYADQVEESSAHDEPFMVRLAHDQLSYLRKRVSKLDEKLKNLNDLLGSRIRRHARSKKWGNEKAQAIDPSMRGLSHVTH
jgi:hypothetical protein